MILFDSHKNTPARLRKVDDCPIITTFDLIAGCMVVASSALLLMINLGGVFL